MRLAPSLVRPLRGSTALQLGCGPGARVLDGLGPADWRGVTLLGRGLSRAALLEDARRHGDDEARRARLLQLLGAAGALVVDGPLPPHDAAAVRLRAEASAWARYGSSVPPGAARSPTHRSSATVAVVGGGGLGAAVSAGLAAEGVGTVALLDDQVVAAVDVVPGGPTSGDVGRRLAHAAAEAVHRVSPGARTACPPRPDLVVLLGAGALDAAGVQHLVQDDVPHLGVLVRDDDVVVGPVVLPGRSACLHCLDLHRCDVDLHRCDVDPLWPGVLRQLVTDRPTARPVPVPALTQVAAGITALMALAQLDGRGTAPGSTATVSLPFGAVRWGRWAPHARCGCVGLPDAGTEVLPGDGRGSTPGR